MITLIIMVLSFQNKSRTLPYYTISSTFKIYIFSCHYKISKRYIRNRTKLKDKT
eukprot:UN21718